MEESACWQDIKLPAAVGQREVDSWTVPKTKHENGGSADTQKGILFNTAHNSAQGAQCGISQTPEGRGAANEDPLWWREGTGGQSLRGTPASPWERVNILLI